MSAPKKSRLTLLASIGTVAAIFVSGLVAPPAATAAVPATAITPSVVLPLASKTKAKKTRITTQPVSIKVSLYGTATKAAVTVKASGTKLHYQWQYRLPSTKRWYKIKGAKKSSYTVSANTWANGTRFRVKVTGKRGVKTSRSVKLTVILPTKTPAKDAAKMFKLSGLRQGVDLSAWQYSTSEKVKTSAIRSWTGSGGFAILRNGTGARPIKQAYTSICTGKAATTGTTPNSEDCAYATLAASASASGLKLGHYWFNSWIAAMDAAYSGAFSGNNSPAATAKKYVQWLKADGKYTKTSTDPLVLDIEPGSTWTKTVNGKAVKLKLRAWTPAEAVVYLNTVKTLLTAEGYHANLYVYMSANRASTISAGSYAWQQVVDKTNAKLWVASWGKNNGRIPASQPKTGPWKTWSIWQYTSNNRISGSGVGALDSDIAKSSAWKVS